MFEYLAMEKPVITTHLPKIMTEIGSENGVIYIDKQKDALKKSIEIIQDNSVIVECVKTRKFVKKFDWK